MKQCKEPNYIVLGKQEQATGDSRVCNSITRTTNISYPSGLGRRNDSSSGFCRSRISACIQETARWLMTSETQDGPPVIEAWSIHGILSSHAILQTRSHLHINHLLSTRNLCIKLKLIHGDLTQDGERLQGLGNGALRATADLGLSRMSRKSRADEPKTWGTCTFWETSAFFLKRLLNSDPKLGMIETWPLFCQQL